MDKIHRKCSSSFRNLSNLISCSPFRNEWIYPHNTKHFCNNLEDPNHSSNTSGKFRNRWWWWKTWEIDNWKTWKVGKFWKFRKSWKERYTWKIHIYCRNIWQIEVRKSRKNHRYEIEVEFWHKNTDSCSDIMDIENNIRPLWKLNNRNTWNKCRDKFEHKRL